MTLVLDTSILIDLERNESTTIQKLRDLSQMNSSPARITFLNEFEFRFGIQERTLKNKEKALTYLNNFSVIQTTKKTADLLASLKHKYDKKGLALPLADLLIATLVIENGMTLITKDKDFERIEELRKVYLPTSP